MDQKLLDGPRTDWLGWSTAGLVLLAILIGGGGAEAPQFNGLLEAGGAMLLCWAAARHLTGITLPPSALVPLLFLLSLLLLVVAQLIPLPPTLWSSLPGREAAAGVFALIDGKEAWHPLSMDPEATRRFAAALLLPAGIFVAAVNASHDRLLLLAKVIVLGALVSVLAAGVQIALGFPPRLYPYSPAGAGVPTGLFANPNHQAQLMLAATILTGFLIRVAPIRIRQPRRSKLPFYPAWLLLPIFVAGAIMTQSRAGLILMVPALLAAVLIATRRRGLGRLFGFSALAVALLATVAAIFPGGLDRGMDVQLELSAGGRITNFPDILFTLREFWPWGSGFGTFAAVFKINENLDLMGQLYLNHAHNEVLELLVEGGLPMAALLLAGLVAMAVRLWRLATSRAQEPVTALTGLAIIAIALLHSLVDYPLRMHSLAAVAAIALAYLQSPASWVPQRRSSPFWHRGFGPAEPTDQHEAAALESGQ